MSSVITSQPHEGVVLLTLNRPEHLNTMTRELVEGLHSALDPIDRDDKTRVVILTGNGRAFCAGLELRGYGDESDAGYTGSALQLFERQRRLAALTQRLHHLRVPVVAAINGPAAGGGFALACASDIRVATPEAVFAVGFIRAGYSACDFGVSWLLPRIVGTGRAHDLMLTGRRCSADEALNIGLVTSLAAPGELLASALAKAEEIVRNPPVSVELTKEGMWRSLEASNFDSAVDFENRQQVLTALTEDAAEAQDAFMNKRRPHYHRR